MAVAVQPERAEALRPVRQTGREARTLLLRFQAPETAQVVRSRAGIARGHREVCQANPLLAREGATALWRTHATAEALAWLDDAERRFPTHGWPHSLRAYMLLHEKDLEGAERACRRALALNRADLTAHLDLSRVCEEQGRYHAALRHALHAARLSPSVREVRRRLEALLERSPDS